MLPYSSFEETYNALEVGDLVFMHRRAGLFEWLVRVASSGAFWNHVALVFDVIPMGDGKVEVILVEAQKYGIEIHRLRKYTRAKNEYVLGFKRLPGLTPAQKERIRGFFLDAVDTPYDIPSAFGWILRQPLSKLLGSRRKKIVQRFLVNPALYVCTSFAQRAFYMAVPPNERDRTLFIPDDESSKELNFLFQMVEISPIDVARSKNTVWLWGERY